MPQPHNVSINIKEQYPIFARYLTSMEQREQEFAEQTFFSASLENNTARRPENQRTRGEQIIISFVLLQPELASSRG
jgi:hypothetical protein